MIFESNRHHSQSHTPTIEDQQSPFFTKPEEESKTPKNDGAFFQPKLTVGAPDDQYEQEADAVADAVLSQSGQVNGVQEKPIEKIQKAGEVAPQSNIEMDKEYKEDGLKMKPEIQCNEEDLEEVNAKFLQTKEDGGGVASPQLSDKITNSRGGGRALPDNTRSEMESAFGADFSRVNIHTDNEAVQMNKELGAQAFTHGTDVYFNSGKFKPESSEGKHLLAHELTHTIQQTGLRKKGEQE